MIYPNFRKKNLCVLHIKIRQNIKPHPKMDTPINKIKDPTKREYGVIQSRGAYPKSATLI